MGSYFFLASLLPVIPPSLGGKLPAPFENISRLIRRNIEPDDAPLVDLSLLYIDTYNFEYFQKGWDIFVPGGTLNREQIAQGQELPFFMRAFLAENDQREGRRYIYDDLWERYFAHAYSLAAAMGCQFLVDYLSWEVRLRNGLVALRTKRTGEETLDHQLLHWMGSLDISLMLPDLNEELDPLLIERSLDEERLKRIYDCEGTNPFSRDTILAYLERFRIFSRWEGVNETYDVANIIQTEVRR